MYTHGSLCFTCKMPYISFHQNDLQYTSHIVLECHFGKDPSLPKYILHSVSRFDVEKECERIDGDGHKNDSLVILNSQQPKVTPNVDASCNVFCFMQCICILCLL